MSSCRHLPAAIGLFCLITAACGEPAEAPLVELPVVVDTSGVATVVTDLGYEVELTAVRVAIADMVFTVAGEVHTASIWRAIANVVIPPAHAHPGHYQGGEITGELPGAFVVDWSSGDGEELGIATLIVATYSASNFTFSRGSADVLGSEDPLVGHTAYFAGTATREGVTTAFTIVVDSPEGRELVGAPFEATLDEDASGTLHLRFDTVDPFEGDTVFDGIDFAALDQDGDGAVAIEPDLPEVEVAYNAFRRVFQTHDHYSIELQE